MEGPENQRWATEVFRDFVVAKADERQNLLEYRRPTHIFLCECLSLYETHDKSSGLEVNNLG